MGIIRRGRRHWHTERQLSPVQVALVVLVVVLTALTAVTGL